jgi:uncharacterized protein YqcC (DUF446 family)
MAWMELPRYYRVLDRDRVLPQSAAVAPKSNPLAGFTRC